MLISEAVIHLHVTVSSICIILHIALNLTQLPIIVNFDNNCHYNYYKLCKP